MFSTDPPPRVVRFCREVVPLLDRAVSDTRLMEAVREIVATDRWNCFDRFHETSETLLRRLHEAGAATERYAVQTGGEIGDGQWIIREVQAVRSATVDVMHPERRRIVDYAANPWQLVQWSGGTPAGGLDCELVVIDAWDELDRLPPLALRGKMVLTRLPTYHTGHRWYARGAAGVIADGPVDGCPEATPWAKFGWGGLPVGESAARLVGCALSQRDGEALRALAARGPVTLHVEVDVRPSVGTHDVISGIVPGAGDPQDEVWAIAHTAEPGAADNAAGVAACLEAAAVLESLIAAGALPRPKRTIRFVFGYECFGFFHYLAHHRRFQPPLAGLCVDTLGIAPDHCDGKLRWHATVPGSAGFVNALGEVMVLAALAGRETGYRYEAAPFVSTDDTLIGDPRYGFPCPFITNHPYRGYHSSADTPEILSPAGLAACTAAVAGYLYYLADAGSPEVRELAAWHTGQLLDAAREADSSARRACLRAEGGASLRRLSRWLWGGDRAEELGHLDDCRRRVDAACPAPTDAPAEGEGMIPRRTRPLTWTAENMRPEAATRLHATGLPAWALYRADGERSPDTIAELLSAGLGCEVAPVDVAGYFQTLAELGFVELAPRGEPVTRERLVADLRALGVQPGMDLMVHSALSRLGQVAGGAETVVDALLEAIGPEGTLMLPSFNHALARVYNPLATPGINGAIPEALRGRPEAVRSRHPSHPVIAIGPKSEALCRGHLEAGVWGQDSPIGRLIHGGGWLLGLGVGNEACTAYHVAEISMPCGCIDQFGSRRRVVEADGTVRAVAGLAWRDNPCPVPPEAMGPELDRQGCQRHGTVGAADCFLVKALDLWRVRREQLRDACPNCAVKPEADDID